VDVFGEDTDALANAAGLIGDLERGVAQVAGGVRGSAGAWRRGTKFRRRKRLLSRLPQLLWCKCGILRHRHLPM
jgi:hypothetical protein